MGYADKDKQRAYQCRWVASLRREWMQNNGPCKLCGSDVDLEVDHIDPTKKADHRVWSWSALRRVAELSKCQVLCAKCHKKKTRVEQRRDPPHGTQARYTHTRYRCRCAACREAHRKTGVAYRKSQASSQCRQGMQKAHLPARVGESLDVTKPCATQRFNGR